MASASDSTRPASDVAHGLYVSIGPSGHPWGGPKHNETMPFAGHRTCEQVRHDEESQRIRRGLGK